MPQKLLVKAIAGSRCPMEGNPKAYISDDDKGQEVDNTSYYQRLVAEGSLIKVKPGPEPKKARGGDQ